MPELPEVETIKRIIEPQITGQKVFGADVCNSQVIAHPSSDSFVEKITVGGRSCCFCPVCQSRC